MRRSYKTFVEVNFLWLTVISCVVLVYCCFIILYYFNAATSRKNTWMKTKELKTIGNNRETEKKMK